MRKVNCISLVKLIFVSTFMVVLTACGGDSIGAESVKEASVEDVGALVSIPVTEEVIFNTTDDKLKEPTWVPDMESSSVKSKMNRKNSYRPSVTVLSQKMISTGESSDGWRVYDASPAGATIESVNDAQKGKVLKLTGDALNNGYAVGYSFSEGSSWSDTANKTIKWSMNYSEDFIIYVRVTTKYGYRYLYYTNSNENYGDAGSDRLQYVHNGLGTTANDGTWRTFTRDLNADLQRHQPDNEVISVDGFLVRGSGLIDDVELFSSNSQHINEVIYEDAEDGKNSRWSVYTSGHEGTISNIDDASKSSRVIELNGEATKTGYVLGAWEKEHGWNHTLNKKISWEMNYCENFVVYISVETEQGHRFMTYTPLSEKTFASNPNYGIGKKVYGEYTYIQLGLNPNTKGCSWQTVSRDLEADLKRYEPSNSITFVNAFLVRGSGKFDNIMMFDLSGDVEESTATSKVKKTGQTTSFYPKDDGYYQKGVALSYTRDDRKEIVTDNVTQLQWQDNGEAKTVKRDWEGAKSYCSALTLGGYNDWRLPTRKELFGIIDFGRRYPSIDTSKFKNVSSRYYWSATTFASISNHAWIVVVVYAPEWYDFGGNGSMDGNDKNYSNYVRCVRAGE